MRADLTNRPRDWQKRAQTADAPLGQYLPPPLDQHVPRDSAAYKEWLAKRAKGAEP